MKRLASSLAKKTSRVTFPPPCVFSRIAPAVTATESTLPGPNCEGSENNRAAVRSVWGTPPRMPKENASSPCDRRKLSTSTVTTMRDAPHAATATANHTMPRAVAFVIGPPQPRCPSGPPAWWIQRVPYATRLAHECNRRTFERGLGALTAWAVAYAGYGETAGDVERAAVRPLLPDYRP